MLWNNANLSLNVAFFRNDPHATSTAGWRLKTFPCGIPTCVTPRETSHSSKEPCNKVKSCFFSTDGAFLRRPRRADLGAARLTRRGIDLGPTGRESRPRPRPRPVARAARSQSRKYRVSFAGHPSGSGLPSKAT